MAKQDIKLAQVSTSGVVMSIELFLGRKFKGIRPCDTPTLIEQATDSLPSRKLG